MCHNYAVFLGLERGRDGARGDARSAIAIGCRPGPARPRPRGRRPRPRRSGVALLLGDGAVLVELEAFDGELEEPP
jgi:hypothetical protein